MGLRGTEQPCLSPSAPASHVPLRPLTVVTSLSALGFALAGGFGREVGEELLLPLPRRCSSQRGHPGLSVTLYYHLL